MLITMKVVDSICWFHKKVGDITSMFEQVFLEHRGYISNLNPAEMVVSPNKLVYNL